MPDLPKDDYIAGQIQSSRIRRQVAGPAPTGQMSLFDDPQPPPLVPGTTLHSDEQKEINRRGMSMVRQILNSRKSAFTTGHSPTSPEETV